MVSIFTGMQPSGPLHIGNYFGAFRYFLSARKKYPDLQSFFMIADLHSLNTLPDPKELKQNIKLLVASLMACGFEEEIAMFCQSHIPHHAELSVILNSIVPIGRLERMTQFKDKTLKITSNLNIKKEDRRERGEGIPLGLLSYPVLQAADILLYKAKFVPVGQDQAQHLELVREISNKFNNIYKTKIFNPPLSLIDGDLGKIMSLTDATKKMSKSNKNLNSCIYLTDDVDVILKKIKSAKTDSIKGISFSPERPEIANLLKIFSACTKKPIKDIALEYEGSSNVKFKTDIADALISVIEPIRKRIAINLKSENLLKNKLLLGSERATQIASETMEKVKSTIGLF